MTNFSPKTFHLEKALAPENRVSLWAAVSILNPRKHRRLRLSWELRLHVAAIPMSVLMAEGSLLTPLGIASDPKRCFHYEVPYLFLSLSTPFKTDLWLRC